MNNDYCLQSYRNNYQDDGAGAGATAGADVANKLYWYQKTTL